MHSPPDAPPDSVDQALAWAEFLDDVEPEKREDHLQDLSRSPASSTGRKQSHARSDPGTWTDFLRVLFPSDPGSFSVRSLLRTLRDMSFSKPDSIRHIASFLDRTSQHSALSSWKHLTDRDELRLRLKVLTRIDQISQEHIPFLTFFFRSSNPLLYREAALAIGTHISSSDALREHVDRFIEQRDIDPNAPLQLNGERSKRRLLLVRAAALMQGEPLVPSDETVLPFTLSSQEPIQHELDGLASHLPKDTSDISVIYDVVGLLYSNDSTRDRVRSLVPALLELLAANHDLRLTRSLLKRWGFILAEHSRRRRDEDAPPDASDAPSPQSLWIRMRKRILDRPKPSDGMAIHLKMYMFWNELIRTLLRFPPSLCTKITDHLMQDDPTGGASFDLLRLRTWALREQRSDLENTREIDAFLEHQFTSDSARPLRLAYQSLNISLRSTPSPIHHPSSNQLDVLERMLEPFKDRNQWRSRPAGLRGLSAFLLMDMTEYTTADAPETIPLFRNAGFSGSFLSGDDQRSSGLKFGTVNLILRLLNWEDPEVSQFIDIYLLHRIESQQVLLALLPSSQNSAILSLLADAFEQFLRIKLHTEDRYDPGRLLLRTCVRNPHPAFYNHFLKLVQGRSYETSSGDPIPVDQWTETIRAEAQLASEPATASPGAHLQNLMAEHQKLTFRDTRHSPVLDRVVKTRQRYQSFDETHADPRDLLHDLLRLIGYSDIGNSPGARSLLLLAKHLHEEDQKLLQSGYPPWSEDDFSSLNAFCKEMDDRYHEHAPRLLPSSLDDIEELEETVEDLVDLLHHVRDRIADSLPLFDQRAFEDITQVLTGALVNWVHSFRELHNVWNEHASDGIWNRDLSGLFTVVETEFSANLSRDLLRTIWTDLRTHVESSDVEMDRAAASNEDRPTSDLWKKHRKLLDWGLDVTGEMESTPESTDLNDLFFDSWSTLLTEAMERGEETRVNALLHDESYRPLMKRQEAIPILNDARTWLYDRYQLPARTVNPSEENAIMGTGAHFLGFLAHFSPVWISLMGGAIFLLDFGDAWTEMARNGDLRGILITVLIGVGFPFLYLFADLRQKVNRCPEDSRTGFWMKRFIRICFFLSGCLVYTFTIVSFFWFLLSRTEAVVHGPGAIGHIVVWTGFALFIGVFLGLLATDS